ncbi:MAG: NADH-quinone oxidoreductase subunit J [Phycisphaerales bacterium]|nr:NADH-quinone oxidoreductase subunit J [Phycisphaerales bacterium]
MGLLTHPYVLYALLALLGVGIALALPRKGRGYQTLGVLLAATVGGLVMVWLGVRATAGRAPLPNLYFYIFSLIALGGALRVITHARPVYAALYFVMTILASAGLFLILSAEFMAFALIIVYAGAILITYLFVIMLATQSPSESDTDVLMAYDTQAREPLAATVAGFVLLGVLSSLILRGTGELAPPPVNPPGQDALADMPRKVENALRQARLMTEGERLADEAQLGDVAIDGRKGLIHVQGVDGKVRTIERKDWPGDLQVKNVELLGFNLLRDHPGSIEIAGVILLMAMLGAVVLSRKQVQMDEDAKARHAERLAAPGRNS